MIYELNHFGIVVRNLEESLEFYHGLFGAKVVFDGFIESSKTDVRYLQIAGGMIELLHPHEPGPDTVFGVTHIAFLSDALDEDYDRLIQSGIEGLVAPKVAGTGVGRLAFVRDPNGARLELLQRDVKMRTEPIEHPIVKAFDHYSLVNNDRDAAVHFYRDLLGLTVLMTREMPNGTTIDYLNYDYDVLELLHRPTPSSDPIFAHIALRVDDVAAAQTAFAEKGVTFEAGTPKAAGMGGSIGIVRDPDGVKIELLDRPDLREL